MAKRAAEPEVQIRSFKAKMMTKKDQKGTSNSSDDSVQSSVPKKQKQ